MSSVVGEMGNVGQTGYAMTKAALLGPPSQSLASLPRETSRPTPSPRASSRTLLAMDGEDPARRLEIFLDRLANESDQGWQHVLDDGFRSILTDGELALRGLLEQLAAAREPLDQGGAWPAVEAMLRRFGWDG